MVARLVRQDDTLRNEFLKRIDAKVAAEKEVYQEYKGKKPTSLLGNLLETIFGDSFDAKRAKDQNKGDRGEMEVAAKLRVNLSEEWVLMNDIIVEPEPDTFTQVDHVVIGPPGLFIIETKAWAGAYTGFKDKWKRKSGNDWVNCDSPTKQNIWHLTMIRKWLEGTGLVKVERHPEEWVKAAVVFTKASWLKCNDCCIPVFDGPIALLQYIKKQSEPILSSNEVNKITDLLVLPIVAKAYINRQIKTLYVEEEKSKQYQNSVGTKKEEPVIKKEPETLEGVVVREGKTRNGKNFIKIIGEYQQAESVRQRYLDDGLKVGLLNKDKLKAREFYFYLEDDLPGLEKQNSETVAFPKTKGRKEKERLVKELKEYRLQKSRVENIAAYVIFSNAEMEALINSYPTNEEELLRVKGFGHNKVEQYGKDILNILNAV